MEVLGQGDGENGAWAQSPHCGPALLVKNPIVALPPDVQF